MIGTAFDEFVDHELMRQAAERRQSAVERVARAEDALQHARDGHTTAKQASERAIACVGSLSPMEAEMALEAAARELSVAERVLDAANLALREADDGVITARGDAHRPVYLAGISRRLAAAKKADEARALLAAAQKEHDAATAMLNHATQNGTMHVIYDASHGAGRPIGDYAGELTRWSQPNGWWNGRPA